MKYNITVLPGDGIGPDIIKEALGVLKAIEIKFKHEFTFKECLIGGCAIDECGIPLPTATIKTCKESDAVLLGAVGGVKWESMPTGKRPEDGLLGIRASLNLFANIRPAIIYDCLKDSSPLKESIIGDGVDLIVVRELTGGIYFGERKRRKLTDSNEEAYDTEIYTTNEIERITRLAFEVARKRNKQVTSVDKANVLESSRLWRDTVINISKDYPDIELNHMYIDNAAMQLVKNPKQFDVILTSNLFGDILSDEASMITGSIGMLPSSSLGEGTLGLYEPIHGSAPDIAGMDKANPIATILSVAMMLRYSLKLEDSAKKIEDSVQLVLNEGYRTIDIASKDSKIVGTKKMGSLIISKINSNS
ncbi:MAG: 3-isopropylmalate dehydrogenase [Clostridiales bacterium]